MAPDPVPEIKFGKTALELLDSRFAEPKSFAQNYGIQLCFGLMGAGVHGVKNWVYRRPKFAGNVEFNANKWALKLFFLLEHSDCNMIFNLYF